MSVQIGLLLSEELKVYCFSYYIEITDVNNNDMAAYKIKQFKNWVKKLFFKINVSCYLVSHSRGGFAAAPPPGLRVSPLSTNGHTLTR